MTMHIGREARIDPRRLIPLRWAALGLVILLLTGFWRLQVARADYYSGLAERNRLRELSLLAPRGQILDREGRVLVDNYPAFTVMLIREHIEEVQDSLDRIARGLNLDRQWLSDRMAKYENTAPYTPIVLKEDATLADITFVEANRNDLSELELVRMYKRRYPQNELGSHLFGYVGRPTRAELDQLNHDPDDMVGKMGLERFYNDLLMGENGSRRVIVDSHGKQVELLGSAPSIPGVNMTLTIDRDVQEAAERALEGRQGAIIALDPRTGDVLAMASRPAFDPNLFAVRIPGEDWNRLVNDPEKPMLNRATQAQLPPGSIFKVIIAAAALEEGIVTPETVVQCPGWARHYGRTFRCWVGRGHGTVNLHKALQQSCDVYFYETGKRLGIDRIAEYARRYGLGSVTGLDFPAEEEGLVPSPEWKREARGEDWYLGETISVALGQGPINVTPLQVAYSVGGILSGGRFARPRLHAGSQPEFRQAEIGEKTHQLIADAMWSVVNTDEGTAPEARDATIEIAGKTSTAQNVALSRLAQADEDEAELLKHNAWFVAASPRTNPEIVVVVLIERGGSGRSVAPLATQVIRAHFAAGELPPPDPTNPTDTTDDQAIAERAPPPAPPPPPAPEETP